MESTIKHATGVLGTSNPAESPTKQDMMKAVTYQGSKSVQLEHVPKPKIKDPADIILKVTAASMYPGRDVPTMEKGQILGREAVGIVEEVGSVIEKFKPGDRVVVSSVIACGKCSYCRRREFSACNCTNDSKEFAQLYGGWAPAAMFGFSRMFGNVPGTQAQYLRVPFGDVNCYKIPNGVSDEKAVFVGETVSTGLHAAELGHVKVGDTVVIWGLGPIGLCAAEWCRLKGAKRVIGIEQMRDRLKFSYSKFKLEVVDRSDLSSDQVAKRVLDMLPEGGADVTIDACGMVQSHGWMQSLEKTMGMEKESPAILQECLMVTRKFGHVVIIADYMGYVDGFSIGHIMMKHLTVCGGQCPTQKYFKPIMDAIEAGEIDPSMMISHRVTLDEVPKMFSSVNSKAEGAFKVLVRPNGQE